MKPAVNIRLGANVKAFNSKMTQVSKKLRKFGKLAQNVGSSLTRSITMPLALAGAASVKLSMDFQKSMTKVETLVGLTSDQVNAMKKDILDMSRETAQAPKDLADGLFFLTSAGLRGSNALETLNQVAKATAAGLGDAEALATVAAAAQNAYGVETLTASEALDKFGIMVRTGMFSADELSQVLGKQLGLASSLGISFDEIGAMIATYTRTTGDATSASNGLSAVMMTFAKLDAEPTKLQAQALDAIGMSAESLKEMMGEQGLMATLQHLQTEFGANGISMASFFSKSQALKTVLGVLGEQTETYTENLDAMAESSGFVADAFDRTAEDSAFKMQQALNGLKVAGTQLGETLEPVVIAITEKIVKLTNWFSQLDDQTKKNIVKFGLIAAALGPVLLGISSILMKGVKFIKFLKSWNIATKVLTASQWLMNAALSANPIGIVIGAIAALVAAIYYFSTSNSKVAITVRNAFKKLANGIINSVNWIIKGINRIGKRFFKTIKPIKNFKYEAVKGLKEVDKTAQNTAEALKELEKNANINTNITTTGEDENKNKTNKVNVAQRIKEETNALERIRLLKQQFNVLNEKDEHAAQLLALSNQRENALLGVEDTNHAEEEKDKIKQIYAKKESDLLAQQSKELKDKLKADGTAYDKFYEKLQKGWQTVSKVANMVFSSIGGLLAAQDEKQKVILEQQQDRETADYDMWYERELMKIEDSTMNEEAKNAAIEELDETASIRKTALEKKQAEETRKIQRRAAANDKKMKLASAIMGTATAIVSALSIPPPLGIILSTIVAGLGGAQVAAIASTPLPALADGGIAFGDTLARVGEYQGASANPEVIAPLSKLRDLLGDVGSGTQKIEIFGKLDGNDIWLSNNLSNTNRLRYT
tara:strand:- start:1136 stop:3784 length:2649 start_codon:yes stop_codon:yes gene_type:complete